MVAEVGVVGEGEGEFTIGEIGGGFYAMVEPLEELAEGEEAGVEL